MFEKIFQAQEVRGHPKKGSPTDIRVGDIVTFYEDSHFSSRLVAGVVPGHLEMKPLQNERLGLVSFNDVYNAVREIPVFKEEPLLTEVLPFPEPVHVETIPVAEPHRVETIPVTFEVPVMKPVHVETIPAAESFGADVLDMLDLLDTSIFPTKKKHKARPDVLSVIPDPGGSRKK